MNGTEEPAGPVADIITLGPAILRRDNSGMPTDICAEAYFGYAGEGDQLAVMRSGPLATGSDLEMMANPWTACIWPGHEDGEGHDCNAALNPWIPTPQRRWCLRRYPTKAAAARALHIEYDRRRAARPARSTAVPSEARALEPVPPVDPGIAALELIAVKVVALHQFQDLVRAAAATAETGTEPFRREGLLLAVDRADAKIGRVLRGEDTNCSGDSAVSDLAETLSSYANGLNDRCLAIGLEQAAYLARKLRDRLRA